MKATYKNYQVYRNLWASQNDGLCFGIVKCRNLESYEIEYFVGAYTAGQNTEWDDVCYIIDNGQRISQSKMNYFTYEKERNNERSL